MGDLKFLLGFLAGWIATTDEGKQAASKFADTAVCLAKSAMSKAEENEEAN